MIKVIISIFFFFLVSPLQAEIYKWTDSQGVVHFSDEPHPGAEKVVLPPTQSSNPPSNAPTNPTPPVTGNPVNKNSVTQPDYTVTISQPKSDSTIRNNQGYVSVVIEVEPELQQGVMLQLMFDNRPLGKPQVGKSFILNNVNRGAHTLAVQIIGANGDVLSTSDPVTFYMQRPRVGMVPNTRPANTP
ncbi:Uncharacterised protein [Legionella busanensis]|uniref:DUF4124 domain-containing protein n=1 Tax=Legionella busanensis TaxID=190655 RepID=A0A378JJE2_9GAMM|nr:DUF4124 domain-containing protein [Legionella busanensis]STX51284.1 Uncharacterised protein [Legionella busanensis]